MTDKKYFGWLWALKLIGKKWYGWTEETQPCPKSWRIYFDDGYSPIEALQEDLTYA